MKFRKIETSYRIIKILKLLFEKPCSFDELSYELETENQSVQKETITKYFSTLREFGCIIEKRNRKFELKHFPCSIDFKQSDLETLAGFQKLTESLFNANKNIKVKNIISKILKISKTQNQANYTKILDSISTDTTFLKYRKQISYVSKFLDATPSKVKISYRNEQFIVLPKYLRYKSGKVYLVAFDEKNLTNKQFLLDYIENITNLSQISSKSLFIQPTVFRLMGRVARGYNSPYEGEVVTYESENSIIVSNKFEDKNELRLRLLKYFDNCEIISPKNEKEEFVKLIDSLIKIYS